MLAIRIKYYYALLALYVMSAQNLLAQVDELPFSKIKLSLNLCLPTGYNNLQEYWEPGKGFGGAIQIPIYFGDIDIGLQYLPLKGNRNKYPDTKTFFLSVGWLGKINLPLNFSVSAGIKAGSVVMTFKDDTISTFQRNESELGLAGSAKANWEIFYGFGIEAGIDFITIYTHRKIKYYVISGGLSYSFDSPKWLKEFFE
ncbi:MAG: hypothetical protein V1720_07130 [bacterium]